MGKTRNHKKLVKGKKRIGRTRKGGYWLYTSDTDKESNFAKLFTFPSALTHLFKNPATRGLAPLGIHFAPLKS